MVSPGIVYDSGTYRVWYVNAYKVKYRELKDGKWSKIRMCKLPYENDAFTWHIDLIKNNDKYEILTCATEDKQDRKHMNLYYAKSDDGLKFGTAKRFLSLPVTILTGTATDFTGRHLCIRTECIMSFTAEEMTPKILVWDFYSAKICIIFTVQTAII